MEYEGVSLALSVVFFLFQSSPHPHLPSFLIERERERDLKCIWQIVKTYLTWWDFI